MCSAQWYGAAAHDSLRLADEAHCAYVTYLSAAGLLLAACYLLLRFAIQLAYNHLCLLPIHARPLQIDFACFLASFPSFLFIWRWCTQRLKCSPWSLPTDCPCTERTCSFEASVSFPVDGGNRGAGIRWGIRCRLMHAISRRGFDCWCVWHSMFHCTG